MHIVMFGDQHLESLGGAQVAMRLQRKFLEKAGHTVTVVAPRLHARDISDAGYVDMPSIPITADREYSLTWPGRRTDRWVDDALAARPPADLVHVQADFWGAFIGHRFAERHGLPVVHTMHNRVDVGIEALAPFPSFVLWALNRWAHRALGDASHGSDGWAYLRRLATRSDAVTAPPHTSPAASKRMGRSPPTRSSAGRRPSSVRTSGPASTSSGTASTTRSATRSSPFRIRRRESARSWCGSVA
ncbi:glycosyltransferase family 4 protein [Microbacterium sp. NIBRBAC000506063]|uniref:glycosyltransferase family 4 protein n=1 Tax=Microbacterium sp. NIBRBAC000506063 TaxID=2734618 RepID=UPI002948C162|nr:glycosyltransferase family 4 protein [Microbacterium sp. NIBRBAC000506063]